MQRSALTEEAHDSQQDTRDAVHLGWSREYSFCKKLFTVKARDKGMAAVAFNVAVVLEGASLHQAQ